MISEYRIYVHSETGKIEVFRKRWGGESYDKMEFEQFKKELKL